MILNPDFPFWKSVIFYSCVFSYVFLFDSFFLKIMRQGNGDKGVFLAVKGGIFLRKNILAICDEEQDYACHFLDYLSRSGERENFPFEVRVFTERESWERFSGQISVSVLLVSETLYERYGDGWEAGQVLVLSEGGEGPPGEAWIEKYQSVEVMVRRVLELAAEKGLLPPAARVGTRQEMKLIGIYSPVGRCLQTTFSFTLGQLLARKHKVLYLNFECFSGLSKMLRQEYQADLSDLIYFLHNGDGRFPYRLEGMTQKVNGLDYIAPAFSCLDLQRVEKEEWLALLEELGQSGLYEYVILDLSEVINGLFDILKLCFRVYTIVREDGFAAAKQAHYEELLTCLNHEDILENTRKCRLPIFRQLPQDLENLTRGELAELVQKLIAEDLKV